jgi:hypothetical protein
MLLQLYVIAPICTPPNLEFGAELLPNDDADGVLPMRFAGITEHAAMAAELPMNLRLLIVILFCL